MSCEDLRARPRCAPGTVADFDVTIVDVSGTSVKVEWEYDRSISECPFHEVRWKPCVEEASFVSSGWSGSPDASASSTIAGAERQETIVELVDQLAVDVILQGVLVGKSIGVGSVPRQNGQTASVYKAWVHDGTTLAEIIAWGELAAHMEGALAKVRIGSRVAMGPLSASGMGFAFDLRVRLEVHVLGASSQVLPVKSLEAASQLPHKSRVELGAWVHRREEPTGSGPKSRRTLYLVSGEGHVAIVTCWGAAASVQPPVGAFVRMAGACVDRNRTTFTLNADGACAVDESVTDAPPTKRRRLGWAELA